MVKNSRKALGARIVRSLNMPVPVEVKEDKHHRPVSILMVKFPSGGPTGLRKTAVISIEETWDICDEWWRGNGVARRYYRVITEGGSATVFHDLSNGAWYQQSG